MSALNFSIYEILNAAIMTNTPAIIVEGVDDVRIYESLADQSLERSAVFSAKWIEELSAGGASSVADAIKLLRDPPSSKRLIEDYVLGIIDRDVKPYRSELPNDDAILVLKYYSIESHFVDEETIPSAVQRFTRVPNSLVKEFSASTLMNNIEPKLLDVYYFALESLVAATQNGYTACFSYSEKIGRKNDPYTRSTVLEKCPALDVFAASYGLSPELATIKKISKGKWLLSVFCESLFQELKSLNQLCSSGAIKKCNSCASGHPEECLYKARDGVSSKTIYSLLIDSDITELQYIRSCISKLHPGSPILRNPASSKKPDKSNAVSHALT